MDSQFNGQSGRNRNLEGNTGTRVDNRERRGKKRGGIGQNRAVKTGKDASNGYDEKKMKRLLVAFIYDFFLKSELKETAVLFERETGLQAGEKRLKESDDVPEGFLYEWWQIFWDVFNARTQRGGSETARRYFEMQLQRQRQEHTYRGVTMHVVRVQQAAEQSGYYQQEMFEGGMLGGTGIGGSVRNVEGSQGAFTGGNEVPTGQFQAVYNANGPGNMNYNMADNGGYYVPTNPYSKNFGNGNYVAPNIATGSNVSLPNSAIPAGPGSRVNNMSPDAMNNSGFTATHMENGNMNSNNGNPGVAQRSSSAIHTPAVTPSYPNMNVPGLVMTTSSGQPPFNKQNSFSQQLDSIPTYINMNIPNSGPSIHQPIQTHSFQYQNHMNSTKPTKNSSSYSQPNGPNGPLGRGNSQSIPENSVPYPPYEMSGMDGLYSYQRELMMLEKENVHAPAMHKDTPYSGVSTPNTFALPNSGPVLPRKSLNSMLPPTNSQLETSQTNSPLNGNTTSSKKRKYTKRSKDNNKKSQPNTPVGSASTPGSLTNKNLAISSNLSTVSEPLSTHSSPVELVKGMSTSNSNSPFNIGSDSALEQKNLNAKRPKAAIGNKNNGNSNPKQSTATGTGKTKRINSKKLSNNAMQSPGNNLDDLSSAATSSKDPGSNNSLNSLPQNVLTDPTPHTDFDPSLDAPLGPGTAFEFADGDVMMLRSLEPSGFPKKGELPNNSTGLKSNTSDDNNNNNNNNMGVKTDQSGFNLDFLDPSNTYNDFNFLSWQ